MFPVPTVPARATGGVSSATDSHAATNSTAPTYAAMASKKTITTPRLAPVALANRSLTYVENMPAIILTSIEEEQLHKQRENMLIMKFLAGMPNLYEIRSHIHTEWNLEKPLTVRTIIQRHIALHMASPSDTKRALA